MTSGTESFDHLAGLSDETSLPTADVFVLEVRLGEAAGEAAGGTGGDDGGGTGGDDGGEHGHVHHLTVGPDGYAYVAGSAPSPDAWVRIDPQVAEALRAGTLPVTAAVQSGRIRVGGDLQALLAHQDALAVVVERVADRDGKGASPG